MGFFSSVGKAIGGSLGGIVGGAASLVGGILGNKSQKSVNNANLGFARQQFEYQKELHKNQMQWRAEDAKKAGLHPMAALGLQGSSFSPVSSNLQANDYSWIGDLGQSAGYAAMKGKDKEQQKQALDLAAKESVLQLDNIRLQNEGLELENDFQRFQLQQAVAGSTFQALRGPGSASLADLRKFGYAIPGQADSKIKRVGDTVSTGETRYQFQQLPSGAFSMEPGNDWAGLYEDKFPLDYVPILQTYAKDLFHRMRGDVVDGMVYSDELAPGPTGWVPVDSAAGRAALRFRNAYTRPFKSGFRALKEFDQFLKSLNSLKYYPFRKHK